MTVTPLGATIGAELSDLKLGSPLASDDVAAVRRALVQHKVLVAPGQHLTVDELVVAGSHLGPLTAAHPVLPPIDADHPNVMEIDTTRACTDPRYRDEWENDTWHTDVSFMPDPPLGSLLSGVVIPPLGGDTAFIDVQAAYASLSEPIRSFIDGLEAEHDGSTEFAAFLARSPEGGTWGGRPLRELVPVRHPMVRVHPESGRKSLFVTPRSRRGSSGCPSSRARACSRCSTSTPRRPSTCSAIAGKQAMS